MRPFGRVFLIEVISTVDRAVDRAIDPYWIQARDRIGGCYHTLDRVRPRALYIAINIAIVIYFSLGAVLYLGRAFFAWCFGKMSKGARRFVSWSSLIMPAKRREEMEGDFFESIETAKARGFGRFPILMLKIAKGLLYVWIGLKLRVTDFVSLEKETP